MASHPLASAEGGGRPMPDVNLQCSLPTLDVSPLLLAQNRILVQSTSVWSIKSLYNGWKMGVLLQEVKSETKAGHVSLIRLMLISSFQRPQLYS